MLIDELEKTLLMAFTYGVRNDTKKFIEMMKAEGFNVPDKTKEY